MNRVKSLLRIHLYDFGPPFIIFWSLMMLPFLVVISPALVIENFEGTIRIAGGSAVYIFMIMTSLLAAKSSLGFSLSLGLTRREYVLSLVIVYLLQSVVSAFILTGMSVVENRLLEKFIPALELQFFSLPGEQTLGIAATFWTHFILLLLLVTLSHCIASVAYRYAKTGLFLLMAAILLFVVLLHLVNGWTFISSFFDRFDSFLQFSFWLPLPIAALMLISWLLLRKAEPKPGL